MLKGRDLVQDIDSFQPETGEMAFWWLGQHSFIVKAAGRVIYLDPFLSEMEGRRTPPLLKPEEVTHAALITGSHDHADHIDRGVWPALAGASPQATFIVPELLRESVAKELNIPAGRMEGVDDGRTVQVDGVRITGIAGAHEFFDRDERTGLHPYMGFILEAGGVCFYYAGDTVKYEGLETKLKAWSYHAAFLPINGRDARRLKMNLIGNMTYQEAADLAGAIRPRLTVPAHWDMFEANSENPELFTEYMEVKYPELAARIPEPGERVVIR